MSQTAGATTDRLLHPREAREIIDRFLYGLPEELIPIAEVPWRVLARDIVAAEDHPAFPAATMDGYAVVAEDPSPWREIVGRQTAGTVESIAVDLGTAAWITTGAPVPAGATAVVPVEETEIADDHVIIHHEGIEPGANIRPIGVDLARGTRVLEAGSLIGPAEIGMLAGLGIDPVPVVRRPRVSILSTGNELVGPARQPGPGQIRDSNRFSLIAATEETGAEVVWSGRGPDDLDALREALIARIAESDVVITSGGVSMGDLDLIKPLLGELAEVHFRRLFMKPGKPFNFATAGRTLLFGLPGNPVSALVGFEIFIRPALGALLGLREVDRPVIRVRLAQATQPSDRIEYQRAVVSIDRAGDLMARTTGSQASSRLASLLGANALVIIPPGAEPLAAGTRVDAVLIGPLQAEHGE
jgi:molybdenum cofactor synthesis domain-containing protein